jgi:hypothetical protein
MIIAPSISPDRFPDLVCFLGGAAIAAKALGVPTSTIRQWIAEQDAPDWAGRLLWFHTAEGREAIAADLVVELRYVSGERNALRQQQDRKERLIDEGKATLAARVKSLEFENDKLRELLNGDVLAEQIAAARSVLDNLLKSLQSDRDESPRHETDRKAPTATAANGPVTATLVRRGRAGLV